MTVHAPPAPGSARARVAVDAARPAFVHAQLVRAREERWLAGVAAGTARHLDLPVALVRGAFVVLVLAGGSGLLAYGALWVLTPSAPGEQGTARGAAPRAGRARDRGQLAAAVVLGLGLLIGLQAIGLASPALLPLLVVAGGVALVWLQADPTQRARWRSTGRTGRGGALSTLAVVGLGLLLLVAGLVGFLAARGQLSDARQGLISTVVVVLGLAVASAPWWVRLTGELRAERRERIRSQERAELAAHVHDSVLQTLAMIRKAGDLPEVQRLARNQERELRSWLYAPRPAEQAGRFATDLEDVAAEVELAHAVEVEVVVVGDCETTPSLAALVKAVREALVNAAKHAGVRSVALYSEVGEDAVEAFVRDRGAGFDPAAVAADRFGLSESVVGRLARCGGTAEVVSAPGRGTEVRMRVTRS